MILNWKSIRPLNGGREKGFEELCAQLARAETPPEYQFVRKGTPDAGVECYAVLNDDSEWAWQAKYFDTLGNTQWKQIKKSVIAAIEKHPRLVRYYVCTPLDRPDARTEKKESAKDKWDKCVSEWEELATANGMTVKFIYWGSHELLERLVRPEHVGRVHFWFDVQGFDETWFNARLDEAIRTAGPRYTPEIHVDLPIASKFEAFGRTACFFEREKARACTIRQELRTLEYSTKDAVDATVDAALATVSEVVHSVLTSFGSIESQPTDTSTLRATAEQICAAEQAIKDLSQLLAEQEREFEAKAEPSDEKTSRPSLKRNSYQNIRTLLYHLISTLRKERKSLEHSDCIAGSKLMLLSGDAGTGKTHLLCDLTRQRISAGSPTVLLMGQRFVSNDAPWPQVLQQLDLTDTSAEKFLGALEAAAQAANSRALLILDALNEGTGRTIWPNNLAAFCAQVERSPWIGIVLAVRSSYERAVIPDDLLERAVKVKHEGFNAHEYDATKAFFVHYDLELPSTPLLAPEFRNPLFLKTLCQGLNAIGDRRLPRGFQGITKVFDLYLSAVNKCLASTLGFDERTPLVRQAVEAFAEATLDSGKRWLPLAQAKQVVDKLLPGRDFQQSLYYRMVTEGILVEQALLSQENDGEFAFIAYERFADHLAAKTLLDRHLNDSDPAAVFEQKGDLAFVSDTEEYVSPGLLEALCTQLPERINQELPSVAPKCLERWGLGAAFRQSLIWRDYSAFSVETRKVLSKICSSEHDFHCSVDILLTVATLPEHPLNAKFLDERLRRETMPDRDAWWSVYLHEEWGAHGAVDRLVDWASSVSPSSLVDVEAVELCATTLSWMLTTSNRFLRDHTTKALVNLLTGRLDEAANLVNHFADVDDPYITERVYAVAYGIAMRSHDSVGIGALAQVVNDRVFAEGNPPPHILLRDYARGVVERALYLNSQIDVVPEDIRPPYRSKWPRIPSEEDIKPLLYDGSRVSHDNGNLEWARNRISTSVMSDDFARYIIGTNSSSVSKSWLSLTLDEPPWKPPPRTEENTYETRQPPRFDLRQIQRYILWRVFDLGWTTERFEHFDSYQIGNHGREAPKAERIGKKYQWIAYHEIMAFLSDRFQYRKRFFEEEGDQSYEGPWQEHLRDIDPSYTISSLRGRTSQNGEIRTWWDPISYGKWGEPDKPCDWIQKCDDLPKVEDLLIVTNPADGSRWLNGQGIFRWHQDPPADQETMGVEIRQLWYICNGYLVKSDDAQPFLDWAKRVDFSGRWMPEAAEVHTMFIGEHIWAPAARCADDGWTQPSYECPVSIRAIALDHRSASNRFDCSDEEGSALQLPIRDLAAGLQIRWSGLGADFVDATGRLVVQDPTVDTDGPSALLLREDSLRDFLEREKLNICWVVLGEKHVSHPRFGTHHTYPYLIITGVFMLSNDRVIGSVKSVVSGLEQDMP